MANNGKNNGGRPRKEIDWKQFDNLCALQCSQEEIAWWFQCGITTIEVRVREKWKIGYREYADKKRAVGRVSLRRLQWKAAEAGNPALLIWLGKQHLGQVDRQELTGKSGGPIQIRSRDDFRTCSDEELDAIIANAERTLSRGRGREG